MAYLMYHLAGEICRQDPETCRHNLSEEFCSRPNMSESPRMNIHVTRSSQSAVRTEFFRQIVPASFRILPEDFPGEMIQRVWCMAYRLYQLFEGFIISLKRS